MLRRGAWLGQLQAGEGPKPIDVSFPCKTIAPNIPCIHNRVCRAGVGRGADPIGPAGLFKRTLPYPSQEALISVAGSNFDFRLSRYDRRIWEFVSNSPLRSLWNLQGVPCGMVVRRTWKAIVDDRIFGHAAELGFYFLFAMFPTLFTASSILGLIARSATKIYDRLLDYLALVIPTQAFGIVQHTFNETTAHSSSGKLTFGLIAAIWSASVGVSALQDTLDVVYNIEDSRSYLKARIQAIALTIVLIAIVSSCLASMFGGDFFAALARHQIHAGFLRTLAIISSRVVGWTVATALLALAFAAIYYWAPDLKTRCWHWLTPGGALGIVGWLLASLGLRIYLNFYNSFSVTYGSLGAVIILMTWFYITGLMLLVGAEINGQIEAAAAQMRMSELSRSPYESAQADIPLPGAAAD
jgi:membrane protein